jgi:hypothetical protein
MNNLTQEQVSELSDHNLTKNIVLLLGLTLHHKQYEQDAVVIWGDEFDNGDIDTYLVDYCNNWNDLMPLVVEHALKIQTFKRRNKFLVRVILNDNTDSFTAGAKTLQRALAECLFLVLQEKANNGN